MASTQEDNKPHSEKSLHSQEGKKLLMVYKCIEEILADPKVPFKEKIPRLIELWVNLHAFIRSSTSPTYTRIVEWAQRHTLNLVLHGDWNNEPQKSQTDLIAVITSFISDLPPKEESSSKTCYKLLDVIRDPWGNDILKKIFAEPDNVTKEEALSYFGSEYGYLIAMRLKKLYDSRCEDFAQRFAKACIQCLRLPESSSFSANITEDQRRYILDVYIGILYKLNRTAEIINELKQLTLEEGLQLVTRFTNKKIDLSRVWKHSSRIADLAAQFYMTAAMTKPVEEIETILTKLLNAWVALDDKVSIFTSIPTIMRRIIQTADSAAHIYICSEVLNEKFGKKIKSFIIELYVRALTTDMNELEKQKTQSENAKVQETANRLSQGFLSLADLLHEHLCVSRECVLTSFSLNPTRDSFERIESLAVASGKAKASDIISSSSTSSTNISADDSVSPVLDTGQTNGQTEASKKSLLVKGSRIYDVLSDAEALGLSEQLCDDLAVVLSSPRYQYLSWASDWNELRTTCDRYLSNVEGTRDKITELKYLNIDYNQFKDWPSDDEIPEYGGIEKGYEQWAEVEEDNSKSSVISDYTPYCSSTPVKYRRKRKPAPLFSSGSEYEGVDRKVDSHGSDIDTASQDADSLGSDGLKRNKKSKKRKQNLSSFAMIMNAHNQAKTTKFNNSDMLSIFNQIDEPGKQQLNISKPSYVNPTVVLPEKRSSDPQVLKSLRMYRTKKPVEQLEQPDELFVPEPKKTPELPNNMNPKVLLDRYDFNQFNKSKSESAFNKSQKNFLDTNSIDKKLDLIPKVVLNRFDNIYNKDKKHSVSSKLNTYRDKRRKLDVLANVPGLNTLDLIRPAVPDTRVHVVQLSNNQIGNQLRAVKTQASSSTTITTTNNSTSTSVTPHIQRIGQPRSSQENKVSRAPDTETVSVTPATITTPENIRTQTPTLVNILSQQIIQPAFNQTTTRTSTLINTSTVRTSAIINNLTTTIARTSPLITTCVNSTTPTRPTTSTIVTPSRPTSTIITPTRPTLINNPNRTTRNPNLINILSQQIIRPPQSSVPIVCISTAGTQQTTTVTTTLTQAQNSLKLVTTNSPQHQLLQSLFNPSKNNNQLIKNVNLVSTTQSNDSRMVQFLCKTDGKTIQLTPFSTSPNLKLEPVDNKTVKAVNTTTASVTTTNAISTSPPPSISTRSVYEENYARFITVKERELRRKRLKEKDDEKPGSSDESNSLPKFQQAFGKTVYNSTIDEGTLPINSNNLPSTIVTATQTNVVTTLSTNQQNQQLPKNSNTSETASAASVSTIKTIPPLQSVQTIPPNSVIYTRQVPVSLAGQTINIISNSPLAQSRNQVFRITSAASTDQKDTVIRSKLSALLAASLQSSVTKTTTVVTTAPSLTTSTGTFQEATVESSEVDSSSNDSSSQPAPMRIALPMMQQNARANGTQNRVMRPLLTVPGHIVRTGAQIRQQLLLAAKPVPSTSTRTPEIVPRSNIEPQVSSSTLEQLREFDLVLEQVIERSSTTGQPVRTQEPELVPVSYQAQKVSPTSVVVVTSYCNIQPAASPALSVTSQSSSSPCVTPAPSSSGKSVPTKIATTPTKSPKSKTVKTTTHTSKASPVPKPQQKPQEDEQTTQRIFDILAEYAEQLRNSPDLNNKPAPRRRSNPPTNPSQNSKRKKSSGKKSTQSTSDMSPGTDDPRTLGSEDSSCGVVQMSVQDSPSQGAPSTEDHQSTQGSSDFSSIRTHQTESNDTTTEVENNQQLSTGRQFIFTDSTTSQPRNVIIADSTVNEALNKIQNNAAVIFPANYIAVVSGNNKILATVPTRTGSNMLLFQSFVNQTRKPITTAPVKTVKYSTIQQLPGISQTLTNVSQVMPSETTTNPENTTNNSDNSGTNESDTPALMDQQEDSKSPPLNENGVDSSIDESCDDASRTFTLSFQPKQATVLNTVRAPVIEKTNSTSETKKIIIPEKSVGQPSKIQNQMQFTPIDCAMGVDHYKVYNDDKKSQANTNGPMLGQTESSVMNVETGKEHTHQKETDHLEDSTSTMNTSYTKHKKLQRCEKELQQRKQAALERELHLQKSLSEECEDLGVDEPSTSDLFPEADLLFDSNNSPSFDQLSHDADKRYNANFQLETSSCSSHEDVFKRKHVNKYPEAHSSKSKKVKNSAPIACPKLETKTRNSIVENDKKTKITLFSDEDNTNSPLRTDLLFDNLDYPNTEVEFDYEDDRQKVATNNLKDGINLQNSNSSYEETTLLPCSPIMGVCSPKHYNLRSPPQNKYKFKYSNRKKLKNALQPQVATKTAEPLAPAEDSSDVIDLSSQSDSDTTVKSQISLSPDLAGRKRRVSIASWEEDDISVAKASKINVDLKSSQCQNNQSKTNCSKLVSQCSSGVAGSPVSTEDENSMNTTLAEFQIGCSVKHTHQNMKCRSSENKLKQNTGDDSFRQFQSSVSTEDENSMDSNLGQFRVKPFDAKTKCKTLDKPKTATDQVSFCPTLSTEDDNTVDNFINLRHSGKQNNSLCCAKAKMNPGKNQIKNKRQNR